MIAAPISGEVEARAQDIARVAYGKLIAMVASRTGDILAAEDALSEAFVAALRTWPEKGVPDNPEAWLVAVAKNKRIDAARHAARLVITDEVEDMADRPAHDPQPEMDDRLRLLFVCAHPAIDEAIRTPLMLQTVLGLEADQIARAFLVSPSAMAQRLVRAKRKIKSAKIPFDVPDADAFPTRLGAVLESVYGAYAVDWLEGDAELSYEAFYLASLLAQMVPNDPEVLGLNALIGLIEARREARICEGVLVPVPEQDCALWNRALIDHAVSLLTRASASGRPGRFQLEAAIQVVHAHRAVTGHTDWRALSQLYLGLMQIAPSVGGAVAHAAVVAEDAGPAEGLKILTRIEAAQVVQYQPFYAVRAQCLAGLKRYADAAADYAQARALCTHDATARWLDLKIAALRVKMS